MPLNAKAKRRNINFGAWKKKTIRSPAIGIRASCFDHIDKAILIPAKIYLDFAILKTVNKTKNEKIVSWYPKMGEIKMTAGKYKYLYPVFMVNPGWNLPRRIAVAKVQRIPTRFIPNIYVESISFMNKSKNLQTAPSK